MRFEDYIGNAPEVPWDAKFSEWRPTLPARPSLPTIVKWALAGLSLAALFIVCLTGAPFYWLLFWTLVFVFCTGIPTPPPMLRLLDLPLNPVQFRFV